VKSLNLLKSKGYCYTGNLISIDSQIRNLKEGKNKIFYFKISPIDNDNISDGCINLALVSECVYLSPTKYV